MQSNQQVIAGGAIQALNTITQALPTNGTSPLATSNATQVPMTPASPMQAFAPAALAVINPNAYQQPVAYAPRPFYKDKTLMAGLGVGLVLVGFAIWRLRR